MADPLHSPKDTNARSGGDQGSPRGKPRWVVAVWIVLAVVFVGLIVFLHLIGAIGPGIH